MAEIDLKTQIELAKYFKSSKKEWALWFLNVELFPFQNLLIDFLDAKTFPLVVMTRGGSKTMSFAVYAAYHATFYPGQSIIYVAPTFRQVKEFFEYLKKFYEESPLLREAAGDKPPIIYPDQAVFKIGKSRIRGFPLGDGSRIRGVRSHCTICDEFGCLDKRTLVETEQGLLRIGDYNPDSNIRVINKDGNLERPVKFIKTPPVCPYLVTTKYGYTFKCSPSHKIFTTDGVKSIEDLREGDNLIYRNLYKFPSSYVSVDSKIVDENMAWLMGLLISEGSINSNSGNMSITTTDKDLLNRFSSKFPNWNAYYRKEHEDPRFKKTCLPSYMIYKTDFKLRDWLENCGLKRTTSHDKEIPWSILQSPRSVVLAFLNGLFEGDGTCFKVWDKTRQKMRIGVGYYTVSKNLIDDLHVLLLKLGVKATKAARSSNLSDKPQWMLGIRGRYAREIGYLLDIPKWKPILADDTITERNKPHVVFTQNRWRVGFSRVFNGKCVQKTFGRFMNREDAVNKAKEVEQNEMAILPIRSIERLDQPEVLYDFELPETHSFYGGGFLQHNSIQLEIFQVIIAGFAATQADPMERQRIRDLKDLLIKQGKTEEAASVIMPPENKLIIGGTAYYAFNHFYKYFSTYQEVIRGAKDPLGAELYVSDPEDYGIFMASWETLPETLMSRKMIENAMTTMDRDLFDMEYNCQFKKDSSGFFPMSQLESCTLSNASPMAPRVKIKGYPERIYVMGVDPASAESLTSDNFAIAVIEVDVETWKGYLVYAWAERNKTWQAYIAQTRKVIRQFKPQYLVIESQGGGVTLKQLLQDEKYIEDPAQDEMIYERQEFNEEDKDKIGAHILEMFVPHTNSLSNLNHDAKSDLDHGLLFFAAPSSDREWESLNDLKKMGKGDQEIMKISDELDMANQNLIATKREISLIHILQTKTGQEHFTIDPALRGIRTEDRPRKDRYSAWLYATHAFRQYLKKRRALIEEDKEEVIPWAAWG